MLFRSPIHRAAIPLDIFWTIDKKFCYYTFVLVVDEEFIPEISNESGGFGWFNIESLPKPLHPGAKAMLFDNNIKINLRRITDDYRSVI